MVVGLFIPPPLTGEVRWGGKVQSSRLSPFEREEKNSPFIKGGKGDFLRGERKDKHLRLLLTKNQFKSFTIHHGVDHENEMPE